MGVANAALEVELKGGGSLLDLIGPALLALAAIAAAAVAARTANIRQREQLAHDRALRAREHVRDTIDVAADRAIAALEAYTSLEVEIEVNEETRAEKLEVLESETATDAEKEAAKKALPRLVDETSVVAEKANKHGMEIVATQQRLRLRLGENDPLVTSMKTLALQFIDLEKKLIVAPSKNRDEAQKSKAEEADKATTEAFREVMRACEAWFENIEAEPSLSHPWWHL